MRILLRDKMIFWKFIFTLLVILGFLFLPVFAIEVHHEYEWWDPTLWIEPPDPGFASCPACHETLGVSGGAHPSTRKACEDCHLLGQPGPFNYEFASLYRSNRYSAPLVYSHIANISNPDMYYNYSGDFIEVEDQSLKIENSIKSSSCLAWSPESGEGICHGISFSNPVDDYFAFNIPLGTMGGPGPYRYAVGSENLPDSTDCLYCHMQNESKILFAWANPEQVNSSHFNSSTKEDCYSCHLEGDIEVESFHIMGPPPEVVLLTTTTTTTTTSTTTTSTTTLPVQSEPPAQTTVPPSTPPHPTGEDVSELIIDPAVLYAAAALIGAVILILIWKKTKK